MDYHTWSYDPITEPHYLVHAFPPYSEEFSSRFGSWKERSSSTVSLGRYRWYLVAWLLAWFHIWRNVYSMVAIMKTDDRGNVWLPVSCIKRRKE